MNATLGNIGASFILPEGLLCIPDSLTACHAFCANRDDISPVVDLLWDRFCGKTKEYRNTNDIFVFNLGQEHKTSAHVAIAAALIARAARYWDEDPDDPSRRFIVTSERPYDELAYYAREVYRLNAPDGFHEHPEEHDPLGDIFLNAILGENVYYQAPKAQESLFRTILRNHIPCIPVDAGCTADQRSIAPGDPVASEMAIRYFKMDPGKQSIALAPFIDPETGREGSAIRNYTQRARIAAAAKRLNVRKVFHWGGFAHLCGSRRWGEGYEHSIMKLFNEEGSGMRSAGVYHSVCGAHAHIEIPEDALEDNRERLMILEDTYPTYERMPVIRDLLENLYLKRLAGSCGNAFDSTVLSCGEPRLSRKQARDRLLEAGFQPR